MQTFSTQDIIVFSIIFAVLFIMWFLKRDDIKNKIIKAGIDSKPVLENEHILKSFKGLVVIRRFIPISFFVYWNSVVTISDKRIIYTLSPVTFFIRISIYFKKESYSISLQDITRSESGRSLTLHTHTETIKIFSFDKQKIGDIFNMIQSQIKQEVR